MKLSPRITCQALILASIATLTVTIPSASAAAPSSVQHAAKVVITVGKAGDNLWPLAISIHEDGRVTGFWTANAKGAKAVPHVRLSSHAVAGLMTLARAHRFFTMPTRVGSGPANAASRFVTIWGRNGSRTIYGRGTIANPAFNQIYAVVLAAAGVPCSPARQCGV